MQWWSLAPGQHGSRPSQLRREEEGLLSNDRRIEFASNRTRSHLAIEEFRGSAFMYYTSAVRTLDGTAKMEHYFQENEQRRSIVMSKVNRSSIPAYFACVKS